MPISNNLDKTCVYAWNLNSMATLRGLLTGSPTFLNPLASLSKSVGWKGLQFCLASTVVLVLLSITVHKKHIMQMRYLIPSNLYVCLDQLKDNSVVDDGCIGEVCPIVCVQWTGWPLMIIHWWEIYAHALLCSTTWWRKPTPTLTITL